MANAIVHYITRGSVRGQCSHKHKTIPAAEECIRQDGKGCASQGGYSDRKVLAVHRNGDVTGPYHSEEG